MSAGLRRLLALPIQDAPSVWIDTEPTGIEPGARAVVQVGLVRFEDGRPRAGGTWLVNPGRPIPAGATAIHGIADEDVVGAPTLEELFATEAVRRLTDGALPGAYNAAFDHDHLVGVLHLVGIEPRWPWLDALTLLRIVDRFERGAGRHKLEAAASRHGVVLLDAHDAGADALAAGCLFYKLAPMVWDGLSPMLYSDPPQLGLTPVWRVLMDTQIETGRPWAGFKPWRAAKEASP